MPEQRVEWRRLGAEAVAIVLSILLAFGLEAWWIWSRDRRQEQEILTQLAMEFETNQAESERTWQAHELARSALEELVGLSIETARQLAPQHLDNPRQPRRSVDYRTTLQPLARSSPGDHRVR